jgi:hypothetical protein
VPVVVADPALGTAYGLGWRQYRRGTRVHVGHGGLTSGFEARVELDPERGTAVCVLVNGVGPRDPATRLAARLFELVGDDATGSTPGSHSASATAPLDPRGLPGAYREIGFETLVTVELGADGPWLRAEGDPGSPLLPTPDPDRFRVERGRPAGEDLVVLRGPDGRVDAITIAGYVHARLPS